MSQTQLQILVLGPVASGKSTMTRHLLCEGGDSWKSLETPQKETGKSPPTPARMLDRPRAEQQQGTAPSHLLQPFKTPKYEVIVVDSLEPGGLPGNPFPGSAPAGAAVLLVPADGGQREASCVVTCQQVLLACNLPAKQLVVCVNKMDATEPPYSRQRYQEISQEVCACLRQLGKNPATVAFLPISGLHGDNLLEPSSRMPWFRGWAGTRKRGGTMATSLQQVLDSLVPGWPQWDSSYTCGGLEGDPVRMSSTPVPCLEESLILPSSLDGTTSVGLKRKDSESPVLQLPKKPRGEALHAGMQPLAPSQGSDLDTALNWQKQILETQCPLASAPPTEPSHWPQAPPLQPPPRPQDTLPYRLQAPPITLQAPPLSPMTTAPSSPAL
ncbi:elongation factor 1-alpha 1-like [Mauremys mutica]|uniref:elongation factor 1-alpha 1-like n=1 Tax=Mauremys mutica TaxID=74926 RepID=UPI001D16E6FC|nr:elongation factor 1-alpha 1-like [Mauremys mutica]